MLDRRTRFALWVRRPGSWVEIAAWAALAAFVVWTIGPALIGHGTFLNTGLLGRYTPWGETFQSTTASTNILNSDTIDTVAPQNSLLTRLAHEGVFGAWNPYVAGGAELGGVPDSGAWSPLALPWWILPLAAAPGWVKLLEIVVVTVGMSLLLRRWGVPRAGWAIAALVYSSSGFMVAWSNWPQTRVAACIPLLFWAIDRAAVGSARVTSSPWACRSRRCCSAGSRPSSATPSSSVGCTSSSARSSRTDGGSPCS